jgi:hypothetical protein
MFVEIVWTSQWVFDHIPDLEDRRNDNRNCQVYQQLRFGDLKWVTEGLDQIIAEAYI